MDIEESIATETNQIITSKWQEWESMEEMTNHIPSQFQYGLTAAPLNLTGISILPDHLVIATSAGLLYFVHLNSFNLMRLKCEDVTSPLTTVCAVRSVDDMVASGCVKGSISIFQLPIVCDNQLKDPFTNNAKASKRFTVKTHSHEITSLHWSKNSMRLFSGDVMGNVGLVDINYEDLTCTGKLLFKLDSRIIQFSYYNHILATSCKDKCFLYHLNDSTKIQVGTKPRNPPGTYGCIFSPLCNSPTKNGLLCARPGKKIWLAGLDGIVLYSYIHKKFPQDSEIELLNCSQSLAPEHMSFGYLHLMRHSVVLSHSPNCVIILDMKQQKILGYSSGFSNIVDVAVSESDEIFVLEGSRTIRCLSVVKPNFGKSKLASNIDNQYLDAFADFIPNKQLIQSIAKMGESVVSKLSTIATPSIISGEKHISLQPNIPFSNQLNDLEAVLVQFADRTNSQVVPKEQSESNEDSLISEDLVLETQLKKRAINREEEDEEFVESTSEVSLHEWKEVDDLSTIETNIEEKEKVLAEILDLSCLKMDHKQIPIEQIEDKVEHNGGQINHLEVQSDSREIEDEIEDCSIEKKYVSEEETQSVERRISEVRSEESCESFMRAFEEASSAPLSYGPPSGSSSGAVLPSIPNSQSDVFSPPESSLWQEPLPEKLSADWSKHCIPSRVSSLVGTTDERLCFCFDNCLFVSCSVDKETLTWTKQTLPFEPADLFPGHECVLFLGQRGNLFFLANRDLNANLLRPRFLAENVSCAAMDRDVIWILQLDKLCTALIVCNDGSVQQTIPVHSPAPLERISCGDRVVWAIDDEQRIHFRTGVSERLPLGIAWRQMESGRSHELHLSRLELGWSHDSWSQIVFKPLVNKEHPQGLDATWWQLCVSDLMMAGERTLVASTARQLWIADQAQDSLFCHPIDFLTGHDWTVVGEERWRCVDAGSVYQCHGRIFCTDSAGWLFSFTPNACNPLPIDLPAGEKVRAFSARPQSLWALTESNKIMIREGLTLSSTLGSGWVQLDTTEIGDVEFTCLSLGMDVVWGVDTRGSILMRQGPLGPPNQEGLNPGWLSIDSSQDNIHFTKVCTGSTFYLVWAVDRNGRIYVREAIFPELSTGTSWLHVPGLLASSVAISEDSVFVLTTSGSVFERQGVSVVNFVGDNWTKIPHPKNLKFLDIAVSIDNRVWCLSEEGLMWLHRSHDLIDGSLAPRGSEGGVFWGADDPSCIDAVGDSDDWEVV